MSEEFSTFPLHDNDNRLHGTVYRPNAFIDLMAEGNWDLNTPLTVRGTTIS
jgi:hypothetical protein